MAVISDYSHEWPKFAGAVYIMWAELNDVCELGGEQAQVRAQELILQAAQEFLSLPDPTNRLSDWAEEWLQRISLDQSLKT